MERIEIVHLNSVKAERSKTRPPGTHLSSCDTCVGRFYFSREGFIKWTIYDSHTIIKWKSNLYFWERAQGVNIYMYPEHVLKVQVFISFTQGSSILSRCSISRTVTGSDRQIHFERRLALTILFHALQRRGHKQFHPVRICSMREIFWLSEVAMGPEQDVLRKIKE